MASEDRILSTARYQAGDGDAVQAFSLGGKTYPLPVTGDALAPFPADTDPRASVFLIDVPPDTILYVGRAKDLAGLTVPQARARMYPLRQTGTFTCSDADQPGVRFLAEPGVTLDVRVMEAAWLGGSA